MTASAWSGEGKTPLGTLPIEVEAGWPEGKDGLSATLPDGFSRRRRSILLTCNVRIIDLNRPFAHKPGANRPGRFPALADGALEISEASRRFHAPELFP